MSDLIVVSGATGKTGSATVRALLKRGVKVRAGYRKESDATKELAAAGAELAKFDAYDEASMAAALQGATGFVCIAPETPDRIEVFDRMLAASRKVPSVKRVVVIGGLVVDFGEHLFFSKDWVVMERHLLESGAPYTMLRCSFFMDPNFWMHKESIRQGAFYIPMGDGGANWIAVDDIGTAAAAAFFVPEALNKIYRIDGPAPVTGKELAAIFTEHCGHPVQFVSPPREVAKQNMIGMGLAEAFAEGVLEMWDIIARHEGEKVYGDFERLVGHKPMSVSDWVKARADAFKK